MGWTEDVVMDAGEQAIALDYARNAFAGVPRRSRRAAAIAAWLARYQDALGLAARAGRLPEPRQESLFGEAALDAATWRALERRLAARSARPRRPASAVSVRLEAIARAVGLDEAEAAILGLAVRYRLHRPVERLWDMVADAMGGPMRLSADPALIALFTGLSREAVERRLAPAATLRAAGLITVDSDGEVLVLDRLRRRLADVLAIPPTAPEAAGESLLGRPLAAALTLADFAHLGPAVGHAVEVLAGALRARRPGTHVLLYGPPGTGKTELCKTLAAAVGAPLFAVGETAEDGHEPGRGERLAELRLAQRLLAGGAPALLLVDEAEELFESGLADLLRGRGGGRAALLRLLETTPVPVLWTANALGPLGAAVIRRMTFAIELAVPNRAVRERLWARELARHGVAMEAAEVARLAGEVAAPPAVAAAAVAAAALTGGGAAAVRRGVLAVAKALGGCLPPAEATEAEFDPELANADTDLAALADRLAAAGAPRAVSLLLAGPPGTGKSAFARDLALRMGLEPMVKRASDLLSRWVGGSEQAIAAAFQQAAEEERFLILDEADGLLADRRGATQSWEVTQVNELLTWMEHHPLPFACTTNVPERLDPAALRRFLVKLRFAPLRPDQARAAFARFFGLPAPAALASLPPLVPADFALVARKAVLFGIRGDAAALVQLLGEEAAARPGATAPIGFRLGH